VVKFLSVSLSWMFKAVAAGELLALRIGPANARKLPLRFSPEAIRQWVAARAVASAGDRQAKPEGARGAERTGAPYTSRWGGKTKVLLDPDDGPCYERPVFVNPIGLDSGLSPD
jgi:hypothetical protein